VAGRLASYGQNGGKSQNNCVISLLNDYLLITVGLGIGRYDVYAHFVAWVHTKKLHFTRQIMSKV
jgi:hypothetical protein